MRLLLRKHPFDLKGRNVYKQWVRRSEIAWREYAARQRKEQENVFIHVLEWYKREVRLRPKE